MTTYKLINSPNGEPAAVVLDDILSIPFDIRNADYQKFLDQMNDDDVEVDGEISDLILAHAAERKFTQQLAEYKKAVARLEQYLVSEGRPETIQMVPTGKQSFNPETGMFTDELFEYIEPAIAPAPATIEVWEKAEDSLATVSKAVPNPAIIKDEEERADAQAIVDATPQAVKDAA